MESMWADLPVVVSTTMAAARILSAAPTEANATELHFLYRFGAISNSGLDFVLRTPNFSDMLGTEVFQAFDKTYLEARWLWHVYR